MKNIVSSIGTAAGVLTFCAVAAFSHNAIDSVSAESACQASSTGHGGIVTSYYTGSNNYIGYTISNPGSIASTATTFSGNTYAANGSVMNSFTVNVPSIPAGGSYGNAIQLFDNGAWTNSDFSGSISANGNYGGYGTSQCG